MKKEEKTSKSPDLMLKGIIEIEQLALFPRLCDVGDSQGSTTLSGGQRDKQPVAWS